ncbi:hypothetical protein [Ferrimonas marina]|uniref:Uncharacterized protein n=1 Tax=Ferrimonas marina TaxID=299255 RepID=A0A1M5ULY3_9GAMM|nr:hypothetical protein [Ferrimonas marina]SHH64004.1 hypothetical protein SAMN02745129_2632 [Ferrimonas marina]
MSKREHAGRGVGCTNTKARHTLIARFPSELHLHEFQRRVQGLGQTVSCYNDLLIPCEDLAAVHQWMSDLEAVTFAHHSKTIKTNFRPGWLGDFERSRAANEVLLRHMPGDPTTVSTKGYDLLFKQAEDFEQEQLAAARTYDDGTWVREVTQYLVKGWGFDDNSAKGLAAAVMSVCKNALPNPYFEGYGRVVALADLIKDKHREMRGGVSGDSAWTVFRRDKSECHHAWRDAVARVLDLFPEHAAVKPGPDSKEAFAHSVFPYRSDDYENNPAVRLDRFKLVSDKSAGSERTDFEELVGWMASNCLFIRERRASARAIAGLERLSQHLDEVTDLPAAFERIANNAYGGRELTGIEPQR